MTYYEVNTTAHGYSIEVYGTFGMNAYIVHSKKEAKRWLKALKRKR